MKGLDFRLLGHGFSSWGLQIRILGSELGIHEFPSLVIELRVHEFLNLGLKLRVHEFLSLGLELRVHLREDGFEHAPDGREDLGGVDEEEAVEGVGIHIVQHLVHLISLKRA